MVDWFIENVKSFINVKYLILHQLSIESTDKLLFTISELMLSQNWKLKGIDLSDNNINDTQFGYILESLYLNQIACSYLEHLCLHSIYLLINR